MAEATPSNRNGSSSGPTQSTTNRTSSTTSEQTEIAPRNENTSSFGRLSGLIRKKRMRFNPSWDNILLKSVVHADAHLARHGESQNRFEQVLKCFDDQVPVEVWASTTKPTWKSLSDRFKKLISDHKVSRRINEGSSGIIEVRGEREELLDDIVLAIDDMEEERRNEREERTTMDKRLQEAGEAIRNRAVGGAGETTETQSEVITPSTSTNSVVGSVPRRGTVEGEDEERQLLDEHIKRMSEFETKRLKIDEDRMAFEVESEKNSTLRLNRDHALIERRLALEEKRFELSERRQVLDSEERKQMSTLLSALTKELTKKRN